MKKYWEKRIMKEGQDLIPDYMVEGVVLYVNEGICTRGFLTAVMQGDFKMMIATADSTNMKCLDGWGKFLYNYVPGPCWGSKKAFDTWVKQGGFNEKNNRSRS